MSKYNNPLISLIVPFYNISKYLKRCVDSIIEQSYKNLEIILVDDGSTDDSGRICDLYKERDNRIQVIHKTNNGLSSARNAGLSAMKGEYVGFVDGDDFIDRYMYETLVKAVLDNDADVVQTGFHHTDENGNIAGARTFRKATYNNLDDMFYAFFEENNIHVGVWTKLYKSKIFRNVRFLEGHVFEDYTILPNILNECKKFVIIDGAFYNYAHNPESITRDKVSLSIIRSRLAAPMYLLKCMENIDKKFIGYAYRYICLSSISGYNKIEETDKIDEETKKEYAQKLINQYRNYLRLYRKEALFKKEKLSRRIEVYTFSINPYFSRLVFYILKNSIGKLKNMIILIVMKIAFRSRELYTCGH
jgi:glycosyltransferase involved in cell wall biosynthesis